MPVGIAELRKIMRIAQILVREARLQASCEGAHLFALELLGIGEEAFDAFPKRVLVHGVFSSRAA